MSARRAATFLAAVGVLVMSSGVALMVTATPANADPEPMVVVCKYVSTPGGTPSHIVIVNENSLSNTGYVAPPNGDEWGDAQGQEGGSIAIRYATEGEQAKDVALSECPQTAPTVTTANVTFVDPTCTVAASYTTSGVGVTFDSPTAAPGATITVHATAQPGYQLTGPAEFTHTFAPAPTGCGGTIVSGPKPDCVANCGGTSVSPPKQQAAAVTPTVVHAGLAGTTVQDVRGEQGLALMVAGMVMLVGAGGLRLRASGRRI